MANPNAPFGFRPARRLTGSHTGQVNEYQIPSSDANAYYINDVVNLVTSSDATDGTPLVQLISETSTPVGSIASFKPVLTNLTLQYHLASTKQKCLVYDDPNQLFEAQSDGTLAQADVGDYMAIGTGTAGSTVTGLSGMQLDEDTVTSSASSSLACIIMRLLPLVNNAFGANGVAEVLFINHAYRTGSGS